MTRLRSAMLGMLVWGFGGAWVIGACGSKEPGPLPSCPTQPDTPTDTKAGCATMPDPCFRYRIQLMGNPSTDLALRAKYIAAFSTACYVSDAPTPTFNCFYETPQEACDAGVLVPEVFGAAPYDKNYPACERIPGTENYSRQVGPDPANNITISYEPAPRQTLLVEVDGVPMEVSGPYRNLPEPPTVGPGQPFNECHSGVLGADGKPLLQHTYILQVNRNAHGGKIHSDLAGFKWPCETMDENCNVVMAECEEPLELAEPKKKKTTEYEEEDAPFVHPGLIARVHHAVPMTDKRSCAWGTNSTQNAAVISDELNRYFSNKNPPAEEVKRLNNAPAYTP